MKDSLVFKELPDDMIELWCIHYAGQACWFELVGTFPATDLKDRSWLR